MRTKSELWQRIREARRRANLTQEQLASRVGVSQSAVGQWEAREAEKRSQPSVESLTALAKITGAPFAWLMSDSANLTDTWEKTETKIQQSPLTSEGESRLLTTTGEEFVRKVPILRWEEVKAWMSGELMLATEQKQTLLCPVSCSDKTFCLLVQGIQNEPLLRNGEIAYIDPKAEASNGKLVLVEYGVTDTPRIRLLMSEDKKMGVVQCANPNWPDPAVPLADVRILGTVIFIGRIPA